MTQKTNTKTGKGKPVFLGAYVPVGLAAKMDSLCQKHDVNRSQLIRRLLMLGVSHPQALASGSKYNIQTTSSCGCSGEPVGEMQQ